MQTNINSADQYQFQPIELNKLVAQSLQMLAFTVKEKNIIIEANIAKQHILINVNISKDNGIGIQLNMQDKIFDLFTITKRKGTAIEKSFDLGRSICKKIGGGTWWPN